MSSQEMHLQKAAHNRRAQAHLAKDAGFCDWYATVAFYAAVHCMEACLAEVGCHSESHSDRARKLRHYYGRTATFRSNHVLDEYTFLFELSIDARYKCNLVDESDCRAADRALAVVESYTRWRLGAV